MGLGVRPVRRRTLYEIPGGTEARTDCSLLKATRMVMMPRATRPGVAAGLIQKPQYESITKRHDAQMSSIALDVSRSI